MAEASIDLKNANLYIRDGYANVAAVNDATGYTTGATTMTIDGTATAIPVGVTFTVAGQATIYTVLSRTPGTGATTSITFAPGLTGAAVDDDVITFKPNEIEVRIGEGNLAYELKREFEYKKNRGKLDYVRNGDETQLSVSFDFVWDHIVGATNDPVTVEEALHRDGNAAEWVSSDPDRCQPYAVDLVFVHTPPCGGNKAEQIIFPKFRYESLNHNSREGSVACAGACNVVRPIITRPA